MQSARGISQSLDENPATMWLKPSLNLLDSLNHSFVALNTHDYGNEGLVHPSVKILLVSGIYCGLILGYTAEMAG
jgi:hypothetical protein